jgi:hypothetical protein
MCKKMIALFAVVFNFVAASAQSFYIDANGNAVIADNNDDMYEVPATPKKTTKKNKKTATANLASAAQTAAVTYDNIRNTVPSTVYGKITQTDMGAGKGTMWVKVNGGRVSQKYKVNFAGWTHVRAGDYVLLQGDGDQGAETRHRSEAVVPKRLIQRCRKIGNSPWRCLYPRMKLLENKVLVGGPGLASTRKRRLE